MDFFFDWVGFACGKATARNEYFATVGSADWVAWGATPQAAVRRPREALSPRNLT